MSDFTMKQHVDPTAIAGLAQRQAQSQAELDQQASQQKMKMIQDVAQSVGSLVASSIEASKARQRAQLDKNLGDSLAAKYVPNTMAPQMGPGLPTMAPEGPTSADNAYQQGEAALPPVSTPDYAGQKAFSQQVQADPKPWRTLAVDMMNPQKNAVENLNTQKAAFEVSKLRKGQEPASDATKQAITAAYEKAGQTAPVLDGITADRANELFDNAIKLSSQNGKAQSKRAEMMKQNLIGRLNDQMSKKMNPANWGPGSMAGKSAALVANADSAINLADQMISGKIPTTEQTMTSLALDANRVLTQVGVPSEKTTAELKAKTGYASFAAAMQYFTAHPEDQKLQAFAKLLKTEVSRQRDQRQAIVDRTLAGEFASLDQLKRLSPQDWEAQVNANGFDVEAAKKGKLKIRPEVGSTMYGWDVGDSSKAFQGPANAGAGMQIDHSAIDAELKRRGVQ